MISNTPQTNCIFCDYSKCPGPTDLETALEDVLIDNAIENTFKQWILTDRHVLVITARSTKEFIESVL
jgi:hypothetical protein